MSHVKFFLVSTIGFLMGVYTCHFLIINHNLNPVLASCIVGSIASVLLFKKDWLYQHTQNMVFCGSFAGMSQHSFFLNYYHYLLISFMAGLVVLVSNRYFKGYGGKLGTTAFICVLGLSLFL